MPARIEDYALIGDCHTAALVSSDGSIDWLCLPRFDSAACFAALLGTAQHGRWLLTPTSTVRRRSRHYRAGTLVLETEYETEDGSVAVIDFMPGRDGTPNVVRLVEGRSGSVAMKCELIIRFDYGSIVPWVLRTDDGISAIGGPDALRLHSDVPLHGENLTTVGDFVIHAGERRSFTLSWHQSSRHAPSAPDPWPALAETESWWREWAAKCTYNGPWRDLVLRSLITLKALTYAPTGGIVAAATTSLPEQIGGVRNWDYRFCWLRDATFTLYSLISAGYIEEARAWRQWLLRAVAGSPADTQIMYGIAGERRLPEMELPWLPGYENSKPVRVGNAASQQFQLDVYGEVADAMYQAARAGLETSEVSRRLSLALFDFLETAWNRPDEGIWEVRGPRRHFTHSKVMAWVAFDRVVKSIETRGYPGPLERWRQVRDTIHEQVCREGFDPKLNSFTQSYGSTELDGSLLMLPLVGFLPATDPRIVGTVAAVEKHLMTDGFVARYRTESAVDGLPAGEGAFLPCTFWLADNYVLQGRYAKGRELFERLIGLCNDVGLLAEEYDPVARRLLGNFPQAFSHVGLVNTAFNLTREHGPAEQRGG